MIIAPLHPAEKFRLIDLASYAIMDTAPEDDFDELVELASQVCNTPISYISLLDKSRQWFKAKKGLNIHQTSRSIAFCSHAILQDAVMVVEDATKDSRFYDNPFVTSDPNIRFYAGAPIVSPSGHNIGAICIMDNKPKKLSKQEERVLTILSNQVTKLLELRKKNLLIRERAEEIINLKSNAISSVIKLQEKEKRNIATNMHEDLAQGIASSIFYLRTAEDNNQQVLPLVEKARQQLQDILVNIQALSYSIAPHMIDLLPASDLVREYIEKTAGTFPFAITIASGGIVNNGTPENAIGSIRIIEHWLKVLAVKKNVSLVSITIETNEQFELLIEDNAPLANFETFKQETFDSLVYERTSLLGGTVEVSVSPGRNLLKIKLPVNLN